MVVETFPKAIVKFYVSFSSESMANQQLRVENCSLRFRANKGSFFMVLEVPTGQIEKYKLPVATSTYNAYLSNIGVCVRWTQTPLLNPLGTTNRLLLT